MTPATRTWRRCSPPTCVNAERQLANRPNCEVLYVDHGAALNTPREVAARVSRFLDDRLDVEKMTQVVDRRLYRARAGS